MANQIEEALRSLIIGNSTINAILSNRVYPLRSPENPTFPFVLYVRTDTEHDTTFTTVKGLTYIYFELSILTKKLTASNTGGYTQGKDLAKLISGLLNGYSGTVLGIDIQAILLKNESQTYDSELETYEVNQDYLVICNE